MTTFDPNAASQADSGIFGLPYNFEESSLVILPVPWEATTSYGKGAAQGPEVILNASRQVDLFDRSVHRPYEAGIYILPTNSEILALNEKVKADAAAVIEAGGAIKGNPTLEAAAERVNEAGNKVNHYVEAETARLLAKGKIPAILGGDHSVPFGAFQAIAKTHQNFGILHFDAHSDTRKAFEGFSWSHASIMFNALERIPQIKKLVQVGIRDFCEEEADYCRFQGDRVQVFYDDMMAQRRFDGVPWSRTTHDIVNALPENVWISFDIDGLDQHFCPHTGTPVPGGLGFNEAIHVISTLVRSGKKIIGFDLNEVAPGPEGDEWDANVGARLLYKLSAWTLASQGKVKF
jgi:agmatinase